jgi:hypothetical protein
MERDFQKKKLNKPKGGGSSSTFDEFDTLQQEGDSTESLFAEIDVLLEDSLKPVEQEKNKREEQKQKKTKSSGPCGCF